MQRLATDPRDRVRHDIPLSLDTRPYSIQRTQRIKNKAIGRLVNPGTALLADVVANLKVQVEDELGQGEKVIAAMLRSTDRIRLTGDQITDVLHHLEIENLVT